MSRCPLLQELEVGYDQGVTTKNAGNIVKLPHLRFYSRHTSDYVHPRLFDKFRVPSPCSAVFNYWSGPTDVRLAYVGLPFYDPSPSGDIKRINLKAIDQKEGFVDATVELVDAGGRRVVW